VLTTGEGGMITMNSASYARELRLLRQHGMSVSDAARHGSKKVVIEEYLCVGYNCRMTDMQAAVGIEQMKKLDGMIARRRELAARYDSALADHSWLRPPHVPDYAEPNFQSYAVSLADDAPISRNDLMQRLLDAGIASRRGIMLSHSEAPYRERWLAGRLPESEKASLQSLLLPLYPAMTDLELDRVLSELHLETLV
jgi:dTDP-4-amino-4,6-dideoxygalactose transaminase